MQVFKDWTKYENKLVQAIKEGNKPLQKTTRVRESCEAI